MTQKEKQLLLVDLSARLPYGVKVDVNFYNSTKVLSCTLLQDLFLDEKSLRPYLRPMSSMTKEEKEWYYLYGTNCTTCASACAELVIDWLNAHHFDYRGLIEKGLALEAPEGIY